MVYKRSTIGNQHVVASRAVSIRAFLYSSTFLRYTEGFQMNVLPKGWTDQGLTRLVTHVNVQCMHELPCTPETRRSATRFYSALEKKNGVRNKAFYKEPDKLSRRDVGAISEKCWKKVRGV